MESVLGGLGMSAETAKMVGGALDSMGKNSAAAMGNAMKSLPGASPIQSATPPQITLEQLLQILQGKDVLGTRGNGGDMGTGGM